MLETYCTAVLYKNRQLHTAVGIALDAHSSQTGRQGRSEDLIAVYVDEWTPALEAAVMKSRETYNVLQENRLQTRMVSHDEYPVIDSARPRSSKGKKGRKKRFR